MENETTPESTEEGDAPKAFPTCPFYSPNSPSGSSASMVFFGNPRQCRRSKCAIWIGEQEDGRCAFVAIAENLVRPA